MLLVERIGRLYSIASQYGVLGLQGLGNLDPEESLEIGPEFVGATRHPQGPYEPLRGPENGHS